MPKPRLKHILITGAMLVAPFLVFASFHNIKPPKLGGTTTQQIRQESKNLKKDVAEKRVILRDTIKNERRALESEFQKKKDVLKAEKKTLSPEEFRLELNVLRTEITTERKAFHQAVEDKRKTFRGETNIRREAFQKKVGEIRAERIEDFFAQMAGKIEAAIDRLDQLADRIDSRLDKLADAGKDVTAQAAALAKAREAIAVAEDALNKAKSEFGKMALSEDPKAAFKNVRVLVNDVAQKVRDAHQALVKIINSIKGLSDTPQPAATTTNP